MPQTVIYSCDAETGETILYNINKETGEPSLNWPHASTRCGASQKALPKSRKTLKHAPFPSGYLNKSKKFQVLKANIMGGSNTVSHRLLLIPTLMICPGLLCIMLMAMEVYLHVICHKKNKPLVDSNMYYRSPFHVVTSVFCGVCRDKNAATKIEQLQDQRRHRYDYLKGITI